MLPNQPNPDPLLVVGIVVGYVALVFYGVVVGIGFSLGAGLAVQGRSIAAAEHALANVPEEVYATTKEHLPDFLEAVLMPFIRGLFDPTGLLSVGAARLGYMFPSEIIVYVLAFAPLVLTQCIAILGLQVALSVREEVPDAE